MKANINQELWNEMNILSRFFLVVGIFCVDLSMKMAGLEQKE